MKSRIDSPDGNPTRRIATVMISAPDASCASRITSIVEYLPVPTLSRDVNSLPRRMRFESVNIVTSLPAAHWPHDLHSVAFAQSGRGVLALRRDFTIQGDRGELTLHAQMIEERVDGEAVGHVHRLTVDREFHAVSRMRCGPGGMSPSPCSLRWAYPDQVRGVPGRLPGSQEN